MSLIPFAGFRSLETHHCVTGSMLHIYDFYNHNISEDMLLGIGSGLSFIYWHMKGMAPMIGGRGNVGRPGEEGLEITAGRRTGVLVEKHHSGSASKAEKALLELLEAGQPVMMNVDMGFLPYFDLPEDFHFGGHAIVVGGYDPVSKEVLIADRDKDLHPVSWEDLIKARGSKFKPFPPENMWFTFDFSLKRQPQPEEIREAILDVCKYMLEAPISNIGVRGILKAASRVPRWPKTMDAEELRWSCFNSYIFIDAEGGTGGGLFRYMYGRFLEEAAKLSGVQKLAEAGKNLKVVGDKWQEVAELFKEGSKMKDPSPILSETTSPLLEIAHMEEALWTRLREMLQKHPWHE
ncbi:MAG: hypothetical protein A2Z14_05590 [Chloroflexi bacterium RBG_16_48_8]|nr:MAG: hypothetical protein A2Z14_05590 [Chloroflexi bacterium RBG_16_48_8]